MGHDLSVSFTGIRFENPFLLASAPPTESEANILRALLLVVGLITLPAEAPGQAVWIRSRGSSTWARVASGSLVKETAPARSTATPMAQMTAGRPAAQRITPWPPQWR